jgi:membrane associated rhomboid family serine protease
VAGALIPKFGAPNVVGAHGVVLGVLALYLLLVHRKLASI